MKKFHTVVPNFNIAKIAKPIPVKHLKTTARELDVKNASFPPCFKSYDATETNIGFKLLSPLFCPRVEKTS